ncbi:MAG: methylmalonyl Co-A mutase-associated GTPase MeaB [Alphaproteobacteria bacterium]
MAVPAASGARNGDAMADLARRVCARDRRALAQAITLVESTRADHRVDADRLLAILLPETGRSIRLGITGVPGVGKSSFVEAFGLLLTGLGHRVAVLAVDPTSRRSGGSILADKTRMVELARTESAFIRPSPAGLTLGGVARRTREAALICEAAGFDIVLIETVGVGQSETAVSDMVDMFLLLLAPASGDELQGIKRGIVELADLIVVNKADGALAADASRVARDYANALRLMRPASPNWQPQVLTCSAIERRGIDAVWKAVTDYRERLGPSGEIAARRTAQASAWMWAEIGEELLAALRAHPGVKARIAAFEADVAAGRVTPSAAARALFQIFLGSGARDVS